MRPGIRRDASKTAHARDGAPERLPVKVAGLPQTRTGFLVTSQSLELIYANAAAIRILSFPREWDQPAVIEGRIRSLFPAQPRATDAPAEAPFVSGRRTYVCRPFLLDVRTSKSRPSMIGLLLERPPREGGGIADARRRFHLSPREFACVQQLICGLTTKEVAERMDVSPNTVKQYVRLVMSKMSVTTRAGIVGKILTD